MTDAPPHPGTDEAAPRTAGTSPIIPDLSAGTFSGWRVHLAKKVVMAILRVVPGFRVEGKEHIPPTGPLLVVANHLHNADPVLMIVVFPRPLHFMAKKELFDVPVVRWIVRGFGAFAVDRGKADRTAIRHAEAALAQSIAVGVFPEGTRSPTRSLAAAYPGIGLLALRSGVPVLPVAITGSERLPYNGAKGRVDPRSSPDPGHRGIRIRFGPTFVVPREMDGKRVTTDVATTMIMTAVTRLLPAGYRGVYADVQVDGDGSERADVRE